MRTPTEHHLIERKARARKKKEKEKVIILARNIEKEKVIPHETNTICCKQKTSFRIL